MLETKAQIQQLVPQVADKELSVLASYYTAYANYRLSSIFEDMEKEQQEDYLNTSIEQLEQVTEEAPEFAEGWALLGNCYGMKAKGMISGMRYGPKSERTIDRARELAPDNPRVAMIYGISLLYKPGMFGGSVKKAVDTFKKAGRYFEEWSPQNSLYPEWGKAENYAWMAQAYIEQDRLADAREAYQTSLQVDPDYYWVKEILLPELINEMDD
ncbi:hypothetical protein [Halalkalibaculum sp. DA384]|uniref:hypothetical protein n=1 Tax=Halalkalibaculum sp. DA384 TaxID=3373606 RepID=UPI00375504F8